MADQEIQLLAGVPPLTSLYVYAAGSCNLACRHCWIVPKFQPDGDGGPYVKLEHVEKAIREGKPLGLRSVKLTGGEPTLHPQFRQLVDLINDAGLDIIAETNGTLIDADLAHFLEARPHFKFISVSLDGATAETHDALRSVAGSYEQAISGIKNLVEVGFHPQVICTLHAGNLSEVDDVVKLAERLDCGSVKFNHVHKVGRGEKFNDDQIVSVPELISLYRYIEAEVAPKTRLTVYFDIPIAFASIRKVRQNSRKLCAVRNILGLLAGGELALCGIGITIPELIYGSIEKDDLREIWNTGAGLIRLREQIPEQLEGICGQCLLRGVCQGACVANNYHISGKLNAPFYFCDTADALGLFPANRKKAGIDGVSDL
jgi:SynChlorMet cassette radical SAM/SPASM protein ScmF